MATSLSLSSSSHAKSIRSSIRSYSSRSRLGLTHRHRLRVGCVLGSGLSTGHIMAASSSSDPAATLYDMPISNHGARVRYAIYAKDIQDVVHIVSPNELGGLKGEEYLKRNPQGKMPLLVLADGTALPESEIIVQYLLDAYADRGPSLKPDDAVSRAKAAYVCRHHDMYIASVQGCMYRAMPSTEARATQLAELYKQLCVLESLCSSPEDGSYFFPGPRRRTLTARSCRRCAFASTRFPSTSVGQASTRRACPRFPSCLRGSRRARRPTRISRRWLTR